MEPADVCACRNQKHGEICIRRLLNKGANVRPRRITENAVAVPRDRSISSGCQWQQSVTRLARAVQREPELAMQFVEQVARRAPILLAPLPVPFDVFRHVLAILLDAV